jgi:hypothetical protein
MYQQFFYKPASAGSPGRRRVRSGAVTAYMGEPRGARQSAVGRSFALTPTSAIEQVGGTAKASFAFLGGK